MGAPDVKVLKVKAQNATGTHPLASPFLRWTTAGNEAADAAARQAMAQEHRLLRDLSDAIAFHEKLEGEEMYQFSRFLIETNVYELRLKEVARLEEEVDAAHRLTLPSETVTDGALDPELPWAALVPSHPPSCLLGLE